MIEKVEAALKNLSPLLQGAGVNVRDVKNGIVTIDIFISSCGGEIPKDLVLELIEEELKDMVPGIKEVVAA